MRYLKEYILLFIVALFCAFMASMILVKDMGFNGLILSIVLFVVLFVAEIIMFNYLQGEFDPIQKAINIDRERERAYYKKKELEKYKAISLRKLKNRI